MCVCSSLVAYLDAVAATRVRTPASCQILYIKFNSGRKVDPPSLWTKRVKKSMAILHTFTFIYVNYYFLYTVPASIPHPVCVHTTLFFSKSFIPYIFQNTSYVPLSSSIFSLGNPFFTKQLSVFLCSFLSITARKFELIICSFPLSEELDLPL